MKNCHFMSTFQSVTALSTNYTFAYHIFFRRLSDMAATIHTFQLGVRNWSIDVIEREIEVFYLRLTPKA